MADYSQWKVTDLKAELKRRGIPQTGLRLKQNIIDRLLEEDAKTVSGDVVGAPQDDGERREPAATDVHETQPTADAPPEETEVVDSAEKIGEPGQEDTAEDKGVVAEDRKESILRATEAPDLKELPPTQAEPDKEPQQTGAKAEEATETKYDGEKLNVPGDDAGSQERHIEDRPAEDETRAERAATQESAMADSPGEPGVPSVPHVSVATTGLSTPLPAEEVLEDRRKRKRRSQSPVPTPDAIANKKTKAEIESPRVVLKEDMEFTKPPEEVPASEGTAAEAGPTAEDRELGPPPGDERDQEEVKQVPTTDDITSKKEAPPALKQDARFKGLFGPTDAGPPRPPSPPADTDVKEVDVEPALHVATAALYVDGFMRPLQPAALRNHLISLASAPGAPADPNCIREFYLDPIKTHCFVGFENISTASRVRSALHNTVWPNERNRKVLFADFVPEDRLQDWIRAEEDSQRHVRGPPPRWTVKYEPAGDGDDDSGVVIAVHQEVDPRSLNSAHQHHHHPTNQSRASQQFSQPPPTGPRNSTAALDRRPSGHHHHTLPPADSHARPGGQGFKPLDDLFMSTTTKPKLYYLPVPREVADRRLDQFDDLAARRGSFPRGRGGRRGGDEMRRYTFEDTDFFVDKGPEYPYSNAPLPHSSSSSHPGRRRWGRGRFGDSWVR